MGKIVGIVVVLFAFAACNSTTKESDTDVRTSEEKVQTKTKSDPKSESGKVVYLTNETFKQKVFNYEANQEWKYEGNVPCIVDFYADWCGPCKQIAPTLEELAKEYDGKVIIYKVNTDKERELSTAFGISSIPTILFIPIKGQPQASQGALPKESFVKAIEEGLLKQNSSEQS